MVIQRLRLRCRMLVMIVGGVEVAVGILLLQSASA